MLSSMYEAEAPLILHGALPALDNDCACPAPPMPARQHTAAEMPYGQVPDIFVAPLPAGWSLLCNTLAGGAPAVLNPSAIARLETFRGQRLLGDSYDRQLASAQLIAPIGTHYPALEGAPDILTAWLHITNACNLDCPYCYVQKSGARMSLETGIKAIDALIATARRHGFRAIKLKYAGGEAVLHYRMVRQLHAYALRQAGEYGLALDAVVLSNGTVMPIEFADWLASSRVRLMLSVDGVGTDHDLQRPWKHGGGGAFAALQRNLIERLLPRGIRPDICITITGRTAHTAQAAVAWAIGFDLPFSLNFYRENEQSAKYADLRYEEQQIIDGMLAAYAVIERELPTRPFLDGLLDRVQAQAHEQACGVGQNYVVISHEGQVAQCQMELQTAQPLSPNSDLIHLVAAGRIHNVSVDEKEGCHACRWRYRCAGGCPLVTLRATGRTDIKSPNCHIYQALIPAALRLEGLRVLKASGYPYV